MSIPGVRYFAFGRLTDDAILASYAIEKKNEPAFKQEASNMLSKVRALELRPEERQRAKTQNGSWFIRVDIHQIAYMALCTLDYPERHAYKMMDELQKNLETILDYQNKTADDLSKQSKTWLTEIVKKYDDLKSIDKLYAAQDNVNAITNQMTTNMNNVFKNMESLESVENKTKTFKDSAGMFEKQSGEMEKIMKWRLLKMRIIFAVVVLFLIWFLFLR
jgi:vesicle-associated membrane protein 7